jgi:hypothetical protein
LSGPLASSKGSFSNLAALTGRHGNIVDGRFNRMGPEDEMCLEADKPPYVYTCIVEPKTSCAKYYVNDVHEVTEVNIDYIFSPNVFMFS